MSGSVRERNGLRTCYFQTGRRWGVPSIFRIQDSKQDHGEIAGIEGGKNDSDKAWEQVLESFKQQSLKMQSVSHEAFMVYSKNAMTMLEETSKTLKIQADKARIDIADITKEISEEGSEYIHAARDNSPDYIKDVIQVFSALPEFNDISKLQDFYLGIPYGSILVLAGFTSFMFTGSTSAIRFGLILGSSLLALSMSSLRAWKLGKSPSLLMTGGQAAIVSTIFLRQWRLLVQNPSITQSLMCLMSGAMLMFYVYRIVIIRGQKLDPGSENH